MRLIRSHSAEWNLQTNRIGAMGFSAGGEVVAMLVYSPSTGDTNSADPVERMDCHADFQIVIYPGPLGVPQDKVPEDAPPAFSDEFAASTANSFRAAIGASTQTPPRPGRSDILPVRHPRP